METIIFELKINEKNIDLIYLRDQGLLFDRIRNVLGINYYELNEIAFDEYDLLFEARKNND